MECRITVKFNLKRMKAILLREINSFFGSPVAYLVIALFLVLSGLFLWVFEGQYNILMSGFADLTPFFTIAPWILLLLIPAVTMRSFADERKQGTLELLLTKPLSVWQIVLGKFFGALVLIVLSVLPTLIYVWVVADLGMPAGNIDLGSTAGSYLGLFFLASAYCAIGIFASALSDNQIVAFMAALLLCFALFFGLEAIGASVHNSLGNWGMNRHFESMGRGVIDTRDVVYFCSVSALFLAFTVYKIKTLKS